MFGHPVGDSTVSEQLYNIQQEKSSITDYALKFCTLAATNLPAYDDTVGLERFINSPSTLFIVCPLQSRKLPPCSPRYSADIHHLRALQNQDMKLCKLTHFDPPLQSVTIGSSRDSACITVVDDTS